MGTDIAAAQGLSTSAPPRTRVCPHNATKVFLPQAAYDIMEDHFLHQNQRPDRVERIKLAHRVNAVLQCYCYSSQNVYMHFVHLRRREKRVSNGCRSGSPSPEAGPQTGKRGAEMKFGVGGATRKHSVVAKLNVLLEEEPSPTPEIAAIWADVLAQGVFAEDILTYALLREVKRHVAESDIVCASAAQTSSSGCAVSSNSELIKPREQTGPSSDPERKCKRRAPQLASTLASSSGRSEAITSGGDASSLDPDSPLVYFLSAEGQQLVQRLRLALSAPTGPQPKTFSELSTWLRGGSVSVTAE